MKRGERQDDEVHDLFDRGAVKQTADQRMFFQEGQPAACGVVNGRCRQGDEEVQQDAESVDTCASMGGFRTQESCRDGERDAPSEED
jgi:hypothetical protein